MRREYRSLQKILDINKWELLQDSLTKVIDMSIMVVDYKGIPVTKQSGCKQFCQLVREDEKLTINCQRCDSRGGVEAIRLNRPYIYLCHCRILDAAIPILVDNTYIGAVMIGQVLLTSEEEMEELEQIYQSSNDKKQFWLDECYTGQYNSLPRMSLSRVKVIVEMLFHLCNYIIAEALEKNLVLELSLNANSDGIPTKDIFSDSSDSTISLARIKEQIDAAVIDFQINDDSKPPTDNITLLPVFDYILNNKSEKYFVNDMARICHISPSYFSKLFFKETGEHFSVYSARIKIEWAKQLLITSDKSINEISEGLGFNDSGHFTKTFKRFEIITPTHYRKLYKQANLSRYI